MHPCANRLSADQIQADHACIMSSVCYPPVHKHYCMWSLKRNSSSSQNIFLVPSSYGSFGNGDLDAWNLIPLAAALRCVATWSWSIRLSSYSFIGRNDGAWWEDDEDSVGEYRVLRWARCRIRGSLPKKVTEETGLEPYTSVLAPLFAHLFRQWVNPKVPLA